MKLHTVFITHDRLALTKRAITSYLKTVSVPWTAIVVDNASSDETTTWIQQNVRHQAFWGVLRFPTNRYPGAAANAGWNMAPKDATHFQRADNDFVFLPGWCDEVQRMFRSRRLGQLGMRTDEEELFAESNVGGNCIITRKLWDQGLRYDERPWPQIREEVGPGHSEDSLLSPAVKAKGFRWDRVEVPCIVNIDEKDPDDAYYQRSFEDRGIDWKYYLPSTNLPS